MIDERQAQIEYGDRSCNATRRAAVSRRSGARARAICHRSSGGYSSHRLHEGALCGALLAIGAQARRRRRAEADLIETTQRFGPLGGSGPCAEEALA